ncbi:response regulator [Bowmanella pacifica]|uniref:response regulator n=1 Tax=Bowmanella pacifica TaxID=502051 RepID=UPI0016645846|nr:response regulator transcription factor [Bowmanella pacifica]
MKILLIDDHQMFLDGLTAMLFSIPGVQSIDSANDGKTALSMLQTGDYDVALIDLRLPVVDGLNVLQSMHQIGSLTPVIMVTASQDPQDIQQAEQYGAMGYLAKSASGREILTAIHRVLAGELVFPDHGLFGQRGAQSSPSQQHWAKQHNLTRRQVQVLRLVKQGLPNQEIAQQLFLSLATVKSHISTLFRVLDAKNRAEAIRKAQQFGLD